MIRRFHTGSGFNDCGNKKNPRKNANGSGKSTLLRLLLGAEAPDCGSLFVNLAEEKTAFCLQEEPALDCTGKELIDEVRRGSRLDPAVLEEFLKRFQITDQLLSRGLSELSSGERKKIFLSLALASRSELLILDEPTNHLDASSVSVLKEALEQYEGTLLLCSHEADFGESFLTRTIFPSKEWDSLVDTALQPST